MRALLLVCILGSLIGCGITAPSRGPGYAYLEVPARLGLRHDTALSLGPTLLRFAARHMEDDPPTAALLRAVDGVRIRVYSITDTQRLDQLAAGLDVAVARLVNEKWRTIVRVTNSNDNVQLLVKERGETIVGLAIMVLDTEELVFVNIMGELGPEQLAALTQTLAADGRLKPNG